MSDDAVLRRAFNIPTKERIASNKSPEEIVYDIHRLTEASFRLEDAIEAVSYTAFEFSNEYFKLCDAQSDIDALEHEVEADFAKRFPVAYKEWIESLPEEDE